MKTWLVVLIVIMILVIALGVTITALALPKNIKGKERTKKIIYISLIIAIVVIIIGLSFGVSKREEENTKKITTTEAVTLENAGFKEISLSDYTALLNGSEKSIILVARPTCGYCAKFTPILKQARDELYLTINYLNTDKFNEDDYTKFNNSLDYLKSSSWGTPLVMIVQNGKLVDKSDGYVELSTIETFFKNNGYGE